MADSNQARALGILRGLKDEFRVGARLYQRPGLYHVLVQLAYESRQTESGYVEHPKLHRMPPVPQAYGSSFKLLAADIPAPCPTLRHYYFGELKGLGKLVELASAATSCLKVLAPRPDERRPDPAEDEVWMEWHYEDLVSAFDALGGEHDHDLWPLVVHELTWRRIPGSPLAGQREIWEEVEHPKHGLYRVRAPYEADLFRRYITSFQGGQPASWSGVEPPFDHFFSVLPCDIYRGSVYAIDLILELANAHPEAPEEIRPIGSSGGRDGGQAQGHDSVEVDHEGWIVGSRRELNRALERSEGYPNYLERQRDMGNLELRTTDDGRYAIRLRDPQRHATVKARLEQRRG